MTTTTTRSTSTRSTPPGAADRPAWLDGVNPVTKIVLALLLSVPLLVCVKLVLEHVEGMGGWARLLE